jgi:hypothetical protein
MYVKNPSDGGENMILHLTQPLSALRVNTTLGNLRISLSILVRILVRNLTHGSGSQFSWICNRSRSQLYAGGYPCGYS